ncbi:uncharacterized protein [Arachis hypogaea]|uniref:uncharacterized protein n=1 Tax=Arachis hypogaea TaxID=3818 RepID=UPI003B21A202
MDDRGGLDDIDGLLRDAFGNIANLEEGNSGLNEDAKRFYKLVDKAGLELYLNCTTGFSRLSFIIHLYHLKCLHGWSNTSFTSLLELLKEAIPDLNIPTSFNKAKNMVKELGLDYEKIDVYPNDCMLYRNEYINDSVCRICGESRYNQTPTTDGSEEDFALLNKVHKVDAKTLRYFPLIPRLKRLFMCPNTTEALRWHDEQRLKDGCIRHPADGQAWKNLDSQYPNFSKELRNLRLGLQRMIRHNLDVMHIEKNIVDSIIGTLLDIPRKTKDHAKARYDLKEMGIRKNLHPINTKDGKRTKLARACFSMTKGERSIFCGVLKKIKLPDGSASNISRCVQQEERKLYGYKTHEHHFMLHYLLQIPIKSILPDHVAIPLVRLCSFFHQLCQKEISFEEINGVRDCRDFVPVGENFSADLF